MIERYKDNKQKYEEIIDYIKNNSDISNDLKKDISEVVEKYRALIFGSEQQEIQEIYDLIDECIRDGSKRKLQRTLHSWIFGNGGYDPDDMPIGLDSRI